MRGTWMLRAVIASAVLSIATITSADPIGTFAWQLAPYCNRVVITVTQVGSIFTLDGYDDMCGAVRKGSVVGTALVNATEVQLLMSTVVAPGGAPVHVDARISMSGFSGTWFDSAGASGTFVFNGPGTGSARPEGFRTSPLTVNSTLSTGPEIRLNAGTSAWPDIIGYKTNGTIAAPTATGASQVLLQLSGGGFDGSNFTGATGGLYVVSKEAFTASARGTGMLIATTPAGTDEAKVAVNIEGNGNVALTGGVAITPLERLVVSGDVRLGTSGTNGCVKRFDGGALTGSCSSDARFKRDIVSFTPSLDAVSRLRPTHFYWRADEFPTKGYGAGQSYGLIAQDVEQVLPELVSTDEDGYKAVDYAKLPLLAIQAIKELKEKNDALEQRLRALEDRLSSRR